MTCYWTTFYFLQNVWLETKPAHLDGWILILGYTVTFFICRFYLCGSFENSQLPSESFPPFSCSFPGLAQLLLMASFSVSSSPDLQSFIISVIQHAPSMLQHLFARVAHVLLKGCNPMKRLAAGSPLPSVVWSPWVCANSRVACVTVNLISCAEVLFSFNTRGVYVDAIKGTEFLEIHTLVLPVWWSQPFTEAFFTVQL